MKHILLRTGALGLAVVVAAPISSLVTACSPNVQNSSLPENPASSIASAVNAQTMNHGTMQHGGMGHSMDMDLGPADESYDLRFLDAMVPHHEGAVVMAKEVLQKSQRPEMKKLAKEIIQAQSKEIAQMKQWRSAWYPKAPTTPMAWHAPMGHMMEMSAEQRKAMMMSLDLGAADAQFDLRFLDAMIPHHEGALVMAKDVLSKSQRPEMKQLAQNILASQQQEIAQMQQWRQAWYGQ